MYVKGSTVDTLSIKVICKSGFCIIIDLVLIPAPALALSGQKTELLEAPVSWSAIWK